MLFRSNKMINPSEFVPPSCQIYRPSNIAYSSGYVPYQSSGISDFYWDTDGMTTTANAITINTPGLYNVMFNGGLISPATALTQVSAYIFRNGVGYALSNAAITSNNLGGYWAYSIIMNLNKNDVLQTSVGIVGGASTSITGSSVQQYTQTRFGATWIGKLV